MDLGVKCRNGNVVDFMRALAKQQMPKGAVHHKVPKAGLWAKPRKPRPVTRHFDLLGPCRGDLHQVIEMGLELARQAIDQGDRAYAERILQRIKKLPLEYERERLIRQLRRQGG